MRLSPTPNGGRVASGNTPYGTYRVEWDANGQQIGTASCEIREPGDSSPVERANGLSVGQMVRGAVGLAKAEMGRSPASDQIVRGRQAVCEACEHYDFGRCGGGEGCKCYLWAKIRLAGERCPKGKWHEEE